MRRLALVAAALCAAAIGLGACGGDGRRDAVESYIQRANSVQREFAADFKLANEAYVAYSKNKIQGDEAIRRLDRARERIGTAGDRLARLKPPADARALHSKLLRVYDMNGEFASETSLLAGYLTGAAAALKPLGPANRRLREGLGRRGAEAQSAALRRFVRDVGGALEALQSIEAPRVLLPTHRDQVTRLTQTRDLSSRLRAALEDADAQLVAKLIERFRSIGSEDDGGTRLARQALRQYDRRYKQLNDAYADVQREQTRLQEELG
jgi:hypothetical protein